MSDNHTSFPLEVQRVSEEQRKQGDLNSMNWLPAHIFLCQLERQPVQMPHFDGTKSSTSEVWGPDLQ